MLKERVSRQLPVSLLITMALLFAFLMACMPSGMSYALDGSTDLVASGIGDDDSAGEKTSLANADVTLSQTVYTFSPGGAYKPVPTVKVAGVELSSPADYTYSYSGNTSAGTAHVTVEGAGDYAGGKTVDFTIKPCAIGKSNVTLPAAKFAYAGKAVQPKPVVKCGAKTLVKGVDYSVSYKNNKKLGTAKLTVTAKGNYVGTVSKSFKIVLQKGAITSAKSPNYQSAKASARKVPGAKKYQFAIGTSKSPSKAAKKTTTAKRSVTFKGLKQATRYYVSVRPLAKVGKKTQYGEWSKPKAVTVKTHAFVGKWSIYSMEDGETSYSPAQVQILKAAGFSTTITLKKDYTGSLLVGLSKELSDSGNAVNHTEKLTWKPTSSTKGSLVATESSSSADLSYKNGFLTVRSGSATMVLRK